jgi:hypothetical protein
MLEKLREKLDAGITWDLKRHLVEVWWTASGFTPSTRENTGKLLCPVPVGAGSISLGELTARYTN